jgi:hypothetical protein
MPDPARLATSRRLPKYPVPGTRLIVGQLQRGERSVMVFVAQRVGIQHVEDAFLAAAGEQVEIAMG